MEAATKRRFTDYFDLLEVDRNATKDDVQKAFMKKASIWHPDKAETESDREYYTKIYQDLLAAYKLLSNERTRKMYIDAQQTTNLEFKMMDRDVGYGATDQFKDSSGKFDIDAFHQSFNQTRDQKELDAMASFTDSVTSGGVDTRVDDSDFQSFLARREQENQMLRESTQQVFSGTGSNFDSDMFNRAFDFMKERNPGNAVQPYEGDPMAMFSGGGLAECDPMSGIQFTNGLSFTSGKHVDNLVLGQSVNPNIGELDLNQLKAGGAYHKEAKLTEQEIQAKMAAIQEQRTSLATMDRSQFIIEPSEIETLYADLFAPMDVEGLEAPIAPTALAPNSSSTAAAHATKDKVAAAAASGSIRKKIEQKKTAVVKK